MVEKHFQKPFQAFCFKITYFIYDLDNYEEFARTGAVMSEDLSFNLNENLKSMFRQNFRLITIHITQGKGQMGRLLILFLFDVVDT